MFVAKLMIKEWRKADKHIAAPVRLLLCRNMSAPKIRPQIILR